MYYLVIIAIFCTSVTTLVASQRYAERDPLPVPYSEHYDNHDYTESYDFDEEEMDIYRWNVEEFPHPRNSSKFCNRLKPSYICDPDQILRKVEADKLESLIQQLYKETPCFCKECKIEEGGIIVGIAILKHMFQPYNEHPSKIIRTFSETLRRQWNLGRCDNDILIAVVTNDRLSFTDVGRSTSAYLSRDDAHRIFLEHKAKFTMGHFYEGLKDILADYHTMTRGMRTPDNLTEASHLGMITGSIVGAILMLGLMLFVIFVLYRWCQRRKSLNEESPVDRPDSRSTPEGISSSWKKQDIKVLFSSLKSTNNKTQGSSSKYKPCDTEDKKMNSSIEEEEEVIDTTLAIPMDHTQLTNVDESTTEMLDKELAAAVEDIAQTFHQPKREYRGHQTDL